MGIKQKLGLGVASAVLGVSLIGGGTYAYFSDTAVQTNTFASGTLDLSVDPTVNVQVANLKPGDWTDETFKLKNEGTLDIKKVKLHTAYTVTKNDGSSVANALANEYADALEVVFLTNTGEYILDGNGVIYKKSLLELRDMTPDELAKEWERLGFLNWALVDGIKAGTGPNSTDNFYVKFKFKDSGEAQNDLQDLKLNLQWTFEGIQEDGEER
jgi:spore coat-associated protein N